MSPQINSIGIDVIQLRKVVRSREYIIDLAIKVLDNPWIPVAAAQGRIHHENSCITEHNRGLIIGGRTFPPGDFANAVVEAAKNPKNCRVPLAVSRWRTHIGGQVTD